MVSKRQKIVVIVVVIVLALTGIVYLMLPQPSPETPSQVMILKASDIGIEWQQSPGEGNLALLGDTSGEISQSARGFWTQNATDETPEFLIQLVAFDTVANCSAAFESSYSSYASSSANYSNVPIGDRAIYVEHAGVLPVYMVMKGSILCWISDLHIGYPLVDSWWANVMLNIVHLQVNKIDQHLES